MAVAANATFGVGGQGEMLRQTVLALNGESAVVYSRRAPAGAVQAVDIPFGGARAAAFRLLRGVPLLGGRRDLLTLLSDLDFDARVARAIDAPALFDGVAAQCRDTIVRLRRRPGARVVVTCYNTHVHHLARELEREHALVGFRGPTFLHRRMRARMLEEIARADHLRVNSHLAKATFVDHGIAPERVTVIHPGVDLDHFHPTTKADDVFRVLAVSTIDPRKGIHYLLQAFEDAKLSNAELVLIGGTGDPWSKRLVEGFVRRNPNIRRVSADVFRAPVEATYGRASVLVHPAVEDGFGLVVPQALASGRPVIVTRSSGAAELVRDGENGFVVDARSVTALANALRLLASDPSLLARLAAQSRPSVAHAGYETYARALRALYAALGA